MSDREREAGERLDRYLDRLAGGTPDPVADAALDPGLLETVRRVNALHARQSAPDPDPAFVQRLGEELMQRATSARPIGLVAPGAPPAVNGRAAPPTFPPAAGNGGARRRPRFVASIAAAAMLLLTLVSGLVAYRLVPSGSPNGSAPAALIAATATAEGAAPNPSECRVTPTSSVPPGPASGTPTMRTLLHPRPAPGTTSPRRLQPNQLPAGKPASAAIVAQITATMRELVACRNAWDQAREESFYSEDYQRRNAQSSPPSEAFGVAQIATPPGPLPPDQWLGILSISGVRIFPDGRVGAIVLLRLPADTPGTTYPAFVVFVNVNGHWLIDEAALIDEPTVELDAIDFAFSRQSVEIPADTPVIIRLYNGGAVPHNLTISGLGVSLDVAPGQTREVTITAKPGQYPFFSALPGQREAGMVGTLRAFAGPAPPRPTSTPT